MNRYLVVYTIKKYHEIACNYFRDSVTYDEIDNYSILAKDTKEVLKHFENNHGVYGSKIVNIIKIESEDDK